MCRNQAYFIFANNSRSKQNKKSSKHPFVDIGKQDTCPNFHQKTLNSMAVGARKNFQFFTQKTWFLENNRALPKFSYEILHYLSSTIKYNKISP